MSFDRCFQENHVGDLKKLASRIEQCRKDFPQAVVNLELIRAAAAMETILRPVQVLTLIEFAGCEIAGSPCYHRRMQGVPRLRRKFPLRAG